MTAGIDEHGDFVDDRVYPWERTVPDVNAAKPHHHRKRTPVVRDDGLYFESATEAERVTGTAATSIIKVAKGERKTAGGHKWRFA